MPVCSFVDSVNVDNQGNLVISTTNLVGLNNNSGTIVIDQKRVHLPLDFWAALLNTIKKVCSTFDAVTYCPKSNIIKPLENKKS